MLKEFFVVGLLSVSMTVSANPLEEAHERMMENHEQLLLECYKATLVPEVIKEGESFIAYKLSSCITDHYETVEEMLLSKFGV